MFHIKQEQDQFLLQMAFICQLQIPVNSKISDKPHWNMKKKRSRRASLSDLTLEAVEAKPIPPPAVHHTNPASGVHFVRRWKDSKNCSFYDCTCGHRRPSHDRKSILRHIQVASGAGDYMSTSQPDSPTSNGSN
jgi:hypothetical protein